MMRINRNKRIGNVIFVVEGKKSEPKLIRDVFQKIFGFDVYQTNKNEDLIRLGKSTDIYSKVVIITNNKPQIKCVLNETDYIDNLFGLLTKHNISHEDSAIYYIFDKDDNDEESIISLMDKFTNSRDNEGYEMNGLFLISYPCIESFYANCFIENHQAESSKSLKKFVNLNRYRSINESVLLNGVTNFYSIVTKDFKIQFDEFDFDNFGKVNNKIFKAEKDYFLKYKMYKTLSLVFVCLFDLDLVSLE